MFELGLTIHSDDAKALELFKKDLSGYIGYIANMTGNKIKIKIGEIQKKEER